MLIALWAVGSLAVPAVGAIAERVIAAVQTARQEAGVAPLVRRADLDALARERARQVAALPHARRLAEGGPIGEEIRSEGIAFHRASLHLDLNRGYPDPAVGFVRSWSRYEASWSSARSAGFDAVGIATARADDGWIVLAAILLDEERPRPAPVPADLEARALVAINDVRIDRGRVALDVNPALAGAARAHSNDMIRRGYFDHVAPDGITAQDRVRRIGLEFSRVGENLHRNAGFDNAVATAVRSWIESDEHRKLLLLPDFRETGVGVAVDDDGTVYFTQLFLAPPARPGADSGE
jgi:uncharacterized protein YkwD